MFNRLTTICFPYTEPVKRFSVAQVQKQQRLAKAVGRVHQFLLILLQVVPRRLAVGQSTSARLQRFQTKRGGFNWKRLCFQVAIQESRLLFQSRKRIHVWQVSDTLKLLILGMGFFFYLCRRYYRKIIVFYTSIAYYSLHLQS